MDTEAQRSQAQLWSANGTRVRTKKGAPFCGRTLSWYYNTELKHFGVVVMATHHLFKGCVHVYPVAQLEVDEQ